MKIGFAGAGGTGKTTLAETVYRTLRDEGHDASMVRETARSVLEEFREKHGVTSLQDIRGNRELFIEFEKEIIRRQLTEERKLEMKHDIVICDRTVYDPLIYSFIFAGIDGFVEVADYATKFRHIEYDAIFITEPLPLNPSTLDDGVRTPDIQHIKKIHEVFLQLLRGYSNAVVVPPLPLTERVSFVLDKLKVKRRGGEI